MHHAQRDLRGLVLMSWPFPRPQERVVESAVEIHGTPVGSEDIFLT